MLPLRRVELRIAASKPWSFGLEQVAEMWPRLKATGFASISPLAIQPMQPLPFLAPATAVAFTHSNGTLVELTPEYVAAVCDVSKSESYPRFGAMAGALAEVAEALGIEEEQVKLANLVYVNKVDEERGSQADTVEEYFAHVWWNKKFVSGSSKIHEAALNFNRAPFDFRLRVLGYDASESGPGFWLETSAGRYIDHDLGWLHSLVTVHDELQKFFIELLTENARKRWGFADGS